MILIKVQGKKEKVCDVYLMRIKPLKFFLQLVEIGLDWKIDYSQIKNSDETKEVLYADIVSRVAAAYKKRKRITIFGQTINSDKDFMYVFDKILFSVCPKINSLKPIVAIKNIDGSLEIKSSY